jgi:hypothetical protein
MQSLLVLSGAEDYCKPSKPWGGAHFPGLFIPHVLSMGRHCIKSQTSAEHRAIKQSVTFTFPFILMNSQCHDWLVDRVLSVCTFYMSFTLHIQHLTKSKQWGKLQVKKVNIPGSDTASLGMLGGSKPGVVSTFVETVQPTQVQINLLPHNVHVVSLQFFFTLPLCRVKLPTNPTHLTLTLPLLL